MTAIETRLREILASGPVVPVYTPGSAREAVEVARALVRGGWQRDSAAGHRACG